MNTLRILFVIQYAPIWPSLRTVYRALQSKPNVEIKVVKTPFLVSNVSDDYWTQIDELLNSENITIESDSEKTLNEFKPHITFLQNPYDNTRMPIFTAPNLTEFGTRVCYVPYGIEMGAGANNITGQFNTHVNAHAWRVFLRSNRNKSMYAKYCAAGDSHVVVSGHPKFDNQENFANYSISSKLKSKIDGRKVVLWSPHFSVGLPASWSTYRIYNQTIMQQVAQRSDVFFIIRPHPLFFKEMLNQAVWSKADEDTFRRTCAEKDNLWLDENADYMESFVASDGLMTDVGSFLLEYLPTKKPIMYLHHPEGFGLNDDGDLVDHYYRANLPEDIPPYIEMISKGLDPMRENRIGIIDEYLFGLDGKSGQRIADYIVEELTKELNETEWHENLNSDEALQNIVSNYWKKTSTLINPSDDHFTHYKDTLSLLPKMNSVVDIGCGDGLFTLTMASMCQHVEAYDIAPKLIHVANQRKQKLNIENVEFICKDYRKIELKNQTDLFQLIDFTSSIISDFEFIKFMFSIKNKINEQGFLIVSDLFSLGQNRLTQPPSGCISKIRSLEIFKELMKNLGLDIISEKIIEESTTHGVTSRLLLFSKPRNQNFLSGYRHKSLGVNDV